MPGPRPDLTLAEARAQLLGHLDDEAGRRFAPVRDGAQDWTNADRALRVSLSCCLDDLVANGVSRLDRRITVTTDATGLVDLSTYDPVEVRGVLIDLDIGRYRLEEHDHFSGSANDTEARDLVVFLVPRCDIPTADADDELLIGRLVGEVRSWPALGQWVVARAALQVGVKDKDRREGLQEFAKDLRKSVVESPRTPALLPYSDNRGAYSVYSRLRWEWRPHTRQLAVVVVGGWR